MDQLHYLAKLSFSDLDALKHAPAPLSAFSSAEVELLEQAWWKDRTTNSDQFEEAQQAFVRYCAKEMRGRAQIIKYKPGLSFSHWVVPRRHNVKEFTLTDPTGRVIAKLGDHPLLVGCFSTSVDATLDLDQLKKHIISRPDQPDAYVYYARRMYRHWEPGWTISLPHKLVESLKPGGYRVRLLTELTDEGMPVFEYRLEGRSQKSIVLVAHICHPGQVNDSMSGALALLQALKALEKALPITSYSYKILLVPELTGSVAYLESQSDAADFIFGLSANMTGHDGPIAFATSRKGNTLIDAAMLEALKWLAPNHVTAPFKTFGDCGDEDAFDTVHYRIPTPTFSRMGVRFAHYHTSLDDLKSFLKDDSVERHQELVNVIYHGLWILDTNFAMTANFRGFPCLSNPDLDLYLSPSNINNARIHAHEFKDDDGNLVDGRLFMQFFLDSLDIEGVTPLEISRSAKLPYAPILKYATAFAEKALVNSMPCERRELLDQTSKIPLHRRF